MDARRFDDLARSLVSNPATRRVALRLLGRGALGGLLASLLPGDAAAACKPPGGRCTAATKASCCSGRCLASGRCACAGSPARAKCTQPPAGSCKKKVCDAGVCKSRPTPGATCDDGKACSVNDVCGDKVGQCTGTPEHDLCPRPGDPCQVSRCQPGAADADTEGCVVRGCPSGSFCRVGNGCFKEIATCPAGTDWCSRTPAGTWGDACNHNRACICVTTMAGATECIKTLAGAIVGDGCTSDAACVALLGLGGVCMKDTGPGCSTTNGSSCVRRCDDCPFDEKECDGSCVPESQCCDALCPDGKTCQNNQCT